MSCAVRPERLSHVDRRLNVVVVDEELPYPPNSGKRIRTLNLLLQLAEPHCVTMICHRNADDEETDKATAFLNERGIETVVVNRRLQKGTALRKDPAFYGRLAMNLFSPRPYVVDANDSAELRVAVNRYLMTHHVDVWQCEWTPLLPVMGNVAADRILVVAHNVESLIWQRYHETERNPVKRWYIHHQWQKMRRFERNALHRARHVVTVSAEDAQLVRDEFGRSEVQVVENGVDTTYFTPLERERNPFEVLFLGSLDWRPNLDAARLLIEYIFPAVSKAIPEAKLRLVGRNPPSWLAQLASRTPGVEVIANVPDVRPMLARCALMAVPLRIGGGSRLKILEALAMETPVVTTAVGCEGLRTKNSVHLVSTDSVDSMASALIENLQYPQPIRDMARRGRELVVKHYDWTILGERLERAWLSCAGAVRQPEAVA